MILLYSGRKGDDEFFEQTGEQYDAFGSRTVHQRLPSSCPQLWASLQVWSISNFDAMGWVKTITPGGVNYIYSTVRFAPSVDALIRLPVKIMGQPAPSLEY